MPTIDSTIDLLVGGFVILTSYFLLVHPLATSSRLSPELRRIAFWAWFLRVGGAFFTYYLYLFYYGGGDIINYIFDSANLTKSFLLKPWQTLEYILFSLINQDYLRYLSENPAYYWFWIDNGIQLIYTRDPATQTVGAFTFPFNLLSLGSINGTIALFATYSFRISFGFFRRLEKVYPNSWQYTAIPILFIPSTMSWIALPYKEGHALLFILYALRGILLERANMLRYIISFAFIYGAYIVKPYIVVSFIPILAFLIIRKQSQKMKRNIILYSLNFLVMIFVLSVALYLLKVLAESSGKYSLENLPKQAYLVQMDLVQNATYYVETGGSVYNIGEFEPTIYGMLSKFPVAFFTGLFRPFLWEAKKGVVLLASIESTALLLFTVYVLFRYGILSIFRQVSSHYLSSALVVFSIIFLFMVGLTSGNFGNLVRYRVPGIFFFYLVIFAVYGELKTKVSYHWGRQ